jgi:hemoglobin
MTIYDEIGGAPAVNAAVEAFYSRVLADPSLAPYFEGISVPRLKGHQRAFIAAALGGPEPYDGRDMTAAHAGLGVTDAAFDSVVAHLVATLTDLGVPAPTIEAIGGTLAPLRGQIVEAGATAR